MVTEIYVGGKKVDKMPDDSNSRNIGIQTVKCSLCNFWCNRCDLKSHMDSGLHSEYRGERKVIYRPKEKPHPKIHHYF